MPTFPESRSRDIFSQNGDSIYSPFNAVVNVTGAVHSPVAVTYVRTIAGVFVRQRVESRERTYVSYVTQPNGKVEATSGKFIFKNDPHPRPGSTVHVPERDPNERRTDYIASIGTLAQVAASLLALAIAIRR